MGYPKTIIKSNNNWIDVSDRKAILFCAGYGCIEYMNTMQLKNVYQIVDNDKSVIGKSIIILGKKYIVQSSSILSELNPDEYFIVITSEKYREEILNQLKEKNEIEKYPITYGKHNLKYKYSNIADMIMLDPFIRRKILTSNLNFDIYEIINKFNEITSLKNIRVNSIFSFYNGFGKLSFIFSNEKEQYFFSKERKFNGRSYFKDEESLSRQSEILKYIKEHNLISDGVIYEDDYGYKIMKIMTPLIEEDISSVDIKAVINNISNLHKLDKIGLSNNNLLQRLYSYVNEHMSEVSTLNITQVLEKAYVLAVSSNKKTVCHGDLHIEHIMKHDNRYSFIDWEFLGIDNPLTDICMFLSSLQVRKQLDVYPDIKKYLYDYYGEECENSVIIQAKAMFFITEIYLYIILKNSMLIREEHIFLTKIEEQKKDILLLM